MYVGTLTIELLKTCVLCVFFLVIVVALLSNFGHNNQLRVTLILIMEIEKLFIFKKISPRDIIGIRIYLHVFNIFHQH